MKTTAQIVEAVASSCEAFGATDIITLWGVPGTGKTRLARTAAEQFTGHSSFVKRVQFHQSYTYEDFIEGLRPNSSGGFDVRPGLFLEWNDQAHLDQDNKYVLLIEELSRANVPAVLGELLTFIEYRLAPFQTPVSRRQVTIAKNLVIVATMNPRDRSAIELDDAVLRRMRVISCSPSTFQLKEMLAEAMDLNSAEGQEILTGSTVLFDECKTRLGERFEDFMPFGHGIFAGVKNWNDVEKLWDEKVRHLLFRPNVPHDDLSDFIQTQYPRRPSRGSAAAP